MLLEAQRMAEFWVHNQAMLSLLQLLQVQPPDETFGETELLTSNRLCDKTLPPVRNLNASNPRSVGGNHFVLPGRVLWASPAGLHLL